MRVVVMDATGKATLSSARIRRAVNLAARKWRPDGLLSVVVVGASEMRRLNRRFTGRRGQTDVLAFELGDTGVVGEVIVNDDLASAEARRRKIAPQDELLLYIVHGVLHLSGYNDHSPEDRRRMYRRESEALAPFGARDVRWAGKSGRATKR